MLYGAEPQPNEVIPTIFTAAWAGVAGAAMGLPTWAVIGGVGLAATALTGDIGQGIMAGFGAGAGSGLGESLSGFAKQGANITFFPRILLCIYSFTI